MSRRLRLLIAERTATRLGIKMALAGEAEVCAEAGDAAWAIRSAMRAQPDLCLIGADVAEEIVGVVLAICRVAPRAAVVVLAAEGDVEQLLDVVRAGAVGYVAGPLDAEHLRKVVRAIADNEAVIPRSMVLDLVRELQIGGMGGDALPARESQVLGMLRRGHSTAEIAARLEIAPVTVRRHISEIVRKLGVEDRAALTQSPTGRWGERHVGGDAQNS